MSFHHKAILALLLVCTLCLNLLNNDFPLGYHPDEVKKTDFILEHNQDFYHPILLLQSTRLLNSVFHDNTPQQTVELGRLISALAGTAATAAIFLLAKRQMGAGWALLAAAMTAATPLVAVHAHYLKEDLLFTCFFLITLLQLLKTLDAPKTSQFLLLGIAAGCAISSKYVGSLLIPLLLAAALTSDNKVAFLKKLPIALFTAAIIFLAINYPLFTDPQKFVRGVQYELSHAAHGHEYLAPIPIGPLDFWFGFHLIYSLVPGIGLITTVLGTIYTLGIFVFWKQASRDDKIIALFILAVYLSAEISPLKPFPDFMRYMVPIAPLLVLFACQACCCFFRKGKILPALCVTAILISTASYTAWKTFQLVRGMSHDTRDISTLWMMDHEGEYLAERYTGKMQWNRNRTLADTSVDKMRSQGIKYLIISSFIYDRINFATQLPHHDPVLDELKAGYEYLFTFPQLEISPEIPSYAFTNPTIRIVELSTELME